VSTEPGAGHLINFARQVNANLTDELFHDILRDWLSLRQSILTWWQQSAKPEAKLPLISSLFVEGGLVDDAAKMDAIVALVSARVPKNEFVKKQLETIVESINHSTTWGFYSKVWLLSKYGTDNQLMTLVETTVSLWVSQEHLSRLVAGLFPRFVNSGHRTKFEAIIRRAGNSWSMSVLQFHLGLSSGTIGYTAIKNFVLAKNTSLPNSISHSKFLMLLSLLNNPDIAPTVVVNLKKVHRRALTDPHYAAS
jgi:hypothetical protein